MRLAMWFILSATLGLRDESALLALLEVSTLLGSNEILDMILEPTSGALSSCEYSGSVASEECCDEDNSGAKNELFLLRETNAGSSSAPSPAISDPELLSLCSASSSSESAVFSLVLDVTDEMFPSFKFSSERFWELLFLLKILNNFFILVSLLTKNRGFYLKTSKSQNSLGKLFMF